MKIQLFDQRDGLLQLSVSPRALLRGLQPQEKFAGRNVVPRSQIATQFNVRADPLISRGKKCVVRKRNMIYIRRREGKLLSWVMSL